MDWIKKAGWDIKDEDVKKQNVLLLAPIQYGVQDMEDFQEYFTPKIFEGTRQDFIRRCKKGGKYDGYTAIIWNSKVIGPLDKELVDAMPSSMRIIALRAAGYDSIDIDACAARGITVTNTPGVVSDATADTAMFLILGCLRRFSEGQTLLRQGKFMERLPRANDLAAKTIGIIGLGGIGKAIAKRANAFGMLVQYYNRRRLDIRDEAKWNVRYAAYDTLLRESDVIVVCVPLTESTRHLLSTAQFEKMKDGVVVINISRGPTIDEAALVAALDSGKVASAGLDVFEFEPRVSEGLLSHPRCTLVPHMGTHTVESTKDMENMAMRNIKKFLLHGEAISPVNKVAPASSSTGDQITDTIDINQLNITLS
ncbi:hypothetical protein DFQ26_002294 [Actinomortierella ambigua]|nr:hypothetical protein DFQ26_002294 [Actinomortierella ambigua]